MLRLQRDIRDVKEIRDQRDDSDNADRDFAQSPFLLFAYIPLNTYALYATLYSQKCMIYRIICIFASLTQ